MELKYIMTIGQIEQLFCEEEGLLAHYSDTSQLSLGNWLEDKEIETNQTDKDDFIQAVQNDYDFEDVQMFADEHFQNLLSIEENIKLFKEWERQYK